VYDLITFLISVLLIVILIWGVVVVNLTLKFLDICHDISVRRCLFKESFVGSNILLGSARAVGPWVIGRLVSFLMAHEALLRCLRTTV
jgi:hypothetical protein